MFLPWDFERALLTLIAVLLGVAFISWAVQARLDGLFVAVFVWSVWFRFLKQFIRAEEGLR